MSRSSDAWARPGRWRASAAGDFGPGMVRCDSRRRCPRCGRDSYCSVLDGAVVYCTKVAEGSVRHGENERGDPWWMHILEGATLHTSRPGPSAPCPKIERADADVLHRGNGAILSALRLDMADLVDLVDRRGFNEASARANAYGSSRSERPWMVARAVERAVGREAALTVPGIVWRRKRGAAPDEGWLHWRAADGLVIPVRDVEGRVLSLQVRRRGDIAKGNRYLWLTSAARTGPDAAASPYEDAPGPSAWAAAHVPLAAAALRGRSDRLLVGEGPLKCDLAVALSGVPVVGVPGVGSWALGAEVARAWGGLARVDICFDMDADRKPAVARARRDLLAALRRDGFDAGVLRWDARHNGIDDFLVARRRGEV